MEVLEQSQQPQTQKSSGSNPEFNSIPEPKWNGSSSWTKSQKEAWELYRSTPFVERNDERFRFTDRSKIRLSGLTSQSHVTEEAQKIIMETSVEERLQKKSSGRFVYANDQLLYRQDLSKELQAQGIIWKPIVQAIEEHPDLVLPYFMKQISPLGSEKFAHLHKAYLKAGTFIFVPKNVEVKNPFETFHWIAEENEMIFPHTLIVTEANAQVEVVDYFYSTNPKMSGFSTGVCDLHAGPGSQVRYVSTQLFGRQTCSFQMQSIHTDRDALSRTLNLNLGGSYSRLEAKCRMIGKASRSEMYSLTVSNEKQEFDQRTFQEHVVEGTSSDLLFKNALADESRTIFSGMIDVKEGAQKTDAYQSNRNLLLSNTADTNSMPGLEINANDVRCTHGSTSSQIDDSEMFYLLSRGIPLTEARRLFTLGFFQEVLQKIDDSELEKELLELIEKKYSHTKSL